MFLLRVAFSESAVWIQSKTVPVARSVRLPCPVLCCYEWLPLRAVQVLAPCYSAQHDTASGLPTFGRVFVGCVAVVRTARGNRAMPCFFLLPYGVML